MSTTRVCRAANTSSASDWLSGYAYVAILVGWYTPSKFGGKQDAVHQIGKTKYTETMLEIAQTEPEIAETELASSSEAELEMRHN